MGRRTVILGVINVRPDSALGEGVSADPVRALALGRRLVADGADALDVGEEPARPGAAPVDESEEKRRVLPAVQALVAGLEVPISVGTMEAGVARAALEAGATIVNDVSGLRADPSIAEVAASFGAALIAGHWARAVWGTAVRGGDAIAVLAAHLRESAQKARGAGLAPEAIWLDPGLGLGVRARTSLGVIRGLDRIVALGHPVVVGPSRKGFIGEGAEDWEAAAALVSLAIAAGAQVVRGYDVARLARVARMADAVLARSGRSGG